MTDFTNAYNVTGNTVRRWCVEFAPFLSDGANPQLGERRVFTIGDGRAIATIANMRSQNATYKSITAALMDGERGSWPPPSLVEDVEDGSDGEEQQETAVMIRLSANLANVEGELKATKAERDRLLASLAKEQETNASTLAEERAARLEAEKVAATAPMLAQELERARAELERERLPWWKRWGEK